jgi:hypothetical protein
VPLTPNIFHYPAFTYPQTMLLPHCEILSFTPYKTTDKIIVLFILIFTFLDSKLKDRRIWTE